MKKTFILLAVLIVVLFGCSQEPKNEVSGTTIESNSETKSEDKRVYLELTEPEEIEIFERAVKGSEKIPGAVNVATPMYTFSLGEDFYSLWITEDSGMIINRKDTSAGYTLSNNSIEEIYKFVSEK